MSWDTKVPKPVLKMNAKTNFIMKTHRYLKRFGSTIYHKKKQAHLKQHNLDFQI